MKIRPEHYEKLERLANCVLADITRDELDSIRYVRDPQRAQRFYVLFMIRERLGSRFISDELYPYLNDDHVYTAMKSIMV